MRATLGILVTEIPRVTTLVAVVREVEGGRIGDIMTLANLSTTIEVLAVGALKFTGLGMMECVVSQSAKGALKGIQ